MFITEKITPPELLSELLGSSARHPVGDFFKSLEHNPDLCPAFEERIDALMDAYMKHRGSVYDIQGLSDKGVDVYFKWDDDEGRSTRVGLQIKSYSEVEADLNRKDRTLIPLLSHQHAQAISKHNVDSYYIILCCGDGKRHRDFVRRVRLNFTNNPGVRVISPAAARIFYAMGNEEVVAYCTRMLCAGDFLVKEARALFSDESHAYLVVAVNALIAKVEGDNHFSFRDLDCNDSQCEQDELEAAVERHIFQDNLEGLDGDSFVLANDAFHPLHALYYDARVRHNLFGESMSRYLVEVLRLD